MVDIDFVKMQGIGNDFIIVEEKNLLEDINYSEFTKKLCDRHFGIGADGLIVVIKNSDDDADITWRIFNSDGSEPEMCGNGIRCFARYVYDKGLVDKRSFTISTLAGIVTPEINDDGSVTVDMGSPALKPSRIPVMTDIDPVLSYPIKVVDREFIMNCIGMGNPHCVIFTDEDLDIEKYGSVLEKHILFPKKTNVEFVQILTKEHIKVDVWERGCGITLACGTGACAAVVAAVLNHFTDDEVTVSLPGGDLKVKFDQSSNHVFMTGPADYSFKGSIEYPVKQLQI